jgi:hypothetical protein
MATHKPAPRQAFFVGGLCYNQTMRQPYLWDYDIDDAQFKELLDGKITVGRLDADWAALRLLEYAPYSEIIRLLGFRRLVAGWPAWREHIRSNSRRRAFDFLAVWLPVHYPELV